MLERLERPRRALVAADRAARSSPRRWTGGASRRWSGAASTWSWRSRTTSTCSMHLRMTGHAAARPARPAAARARDVRVRRRARRCVFDDPRRFGTGELALGNAAREEFFAARLGVEPLVARLHRRAPVRAHAREPGADQGVPARPAQGRRRGEHLRRRGAVPRADPPAAAGRAAQARAGRGAARRGGRGRSRRGSRRRARRSTTSATRTASRGRSRTASSSTCARASRACAAGAGAQAARGGARDLRLRALPAAAAAAALRRRRAGRPAGRRGRRRRAPGSRPSGSPSTITWGKVIMPVLATSWARPSGSLPRLTSSYGMPRRSSRAFAVRQNPQGSVV